MFLKFININKNNCLQDKIVTNLEHIKNQLTSVTALQKATDKLFTTWPINKFGKELIINNPKNSKNYWRYRLLLDFIVSFARRGSIIHL